MWLSILKKFIIYKINLANPYFFNQKKRIVHSKEIWLNLH